MIVTSLWMRKKCRAVDIFHFLFLFLLCLKNGWHLIVQCMGTGIWAGGGGKIQHGYGNMASTNND